MKTQYLCLPLIKTTTTNTPTSAPTSRSPPASSLLDRFREAVFRVIMVTALSKSNNSPSSSSSSNKSSPSYKRAYHRTNTSNSNNESVRRSYHVQDPYPSEAMADCIEFIKKKSGSSSLPSDLNYEDAESTHRDSTVSTDMIIPLPIIM